jgi:hypothetical protein
MASQYTTRVVANIDSVSDTAFTTKAMAANGGYAEVAFDIIESAIGYGTINSVTIKYTCYGDHTAWDRATIRTGYVHTGLGDGYSWQVTHSKGVPRKNETPSTYTDTFKPSRSTDGSYHLLIGTSNNQAFTKVAVIVSNLSITIDYTPATYTVTWKNYDGTVLKTDTGVPRGTTPTYNGATPTKSQDKQNTYSFKEWRDSKNNLPTSVSGDVTYTAQFTSSPRLYEVKVECVPSSETGESCQAVGAGKYTFGSKVEIKSTNMPSNHKVSNWEIYGKTWYFYYTDPFTFTIDDNITADGAYGLITVKCTIVLDRINLILVDKSQSLGVVVDVDTEDNDVVYVDLTKVYG